MKQNVVMHFQRETFEGDECLIPWLRYLGHARYPVARPGYLTAHAHSDCFEFFYFVRGHVCWWVEEEMRELHGNDLYVIAPGERHGAVKDVLQPCEYYWVQVHWPTLRRKSRGASSSLGDVVQGIGDLRHHAFPGSPHLTSFYEDLFREHRHPDLHSSPAVQAILHLLLTAILRRYQDFLTTSPAMATTALQSSIVWCRGNLPEASVSAMAEQARMGQERFRQEFFQHMGMKPAEFIQRQKIEEGKRLLNMGKSVTEVAHALAFSSSQYFATAFKKMEGIQPSEYVALETKRLSEPSLNVHVPKIKLKK